MKNIIISFFIILSLFAVGQNIKQQNSIDSLIKILSLTKSDTARITILLSISNTYREFETNNALEYCDKAMSLSKKINNNQKYYNSCLTKALIKYRLGDNKIAISYFKKIIDSSEDKTNLRGKAYLNIGNLYADLGKYDSSLVFYNNALEIFTTLNLNGSKATVLSNIGTIYSDLGDYEKAILYYTKAQSAHKEYGNKLGQAASVENIGIIYYYQKNYVKALEYFNSSLEIMRKVGRQDKMANTLNNIASLYLIMENKQEAINHFKEAESIYQKIGEKSGQAEVLQNLAQLYFISEKHEDGIKAINKAIIIFNEVGYAKGVGTCNKELGSFYSDINEPLKSIEHLNKALEILEPLEVKNDLREIYHLLAIANTKAKRYEEATKYYEKFIVINDTIYNTEQNKQLAEMQTKYDTEKKQQELELKSIQFENEKLISKKKTLQLYYALLGIFLFIILIMIILRSYRQKQKANNLLNKQKNEITLKNEELNQQNEEIRTQRDEIEKQKEIAETIHLEISESIDYATRLQKSILPEEKVLKKYISEHFVLFKPKDKVSGDFYWWAHIENHTIITAADSTGHGVPGAFMSMLGVSFLREIVMKEYMTHTGIILKRLRKEIIKSLKQKDEVGEQKDGMDMAIISIDHETNIVQFSGANNPLYIVKSGKLKVKSEKNNTIKLYELDELSTFKLYEIKPNKMPIAIYQKMDNFTTHEIQLEKGDQLYMFSDGFADQFGGEKGKKFKYKPFKKLLLENADKPMFEQKEILNNTFHDWKGKYEQIDDVVILGIKI